MTEIKFALDKERFSQTLPAIPRRGDIIITRRRMCIVKEVVFDLDENTNDRSYKIIVVLREIMTNDYKKDLTE